MEELEQKWDLFLKIHLEKTIENLHLKYVENVEHEMARAICLWKFAKTIESNTERREFLRYFVVDVAISLNSVKTVAMVESLPDRVWRKLLWKENMDFMSRESFLRRLTNRQKIAIENAYNSLFGKEPVIPVCLSEGFLYKITHFFKKESVESLLSEDYSNYNRMQSKGAWAFNLLELDFGFSLYPNGECDDTVITNKKWTRFFSVKEHINDFIINQEFGMYWKLYRSARSNYVIRPKKKVELKNHVCPGFWMTLFIHAIFWIISPVIAALCILNTHMGFHLWEIPILLVGSITPLWSMIAFLKWGINSLTSGIARLFKIKLSDRAKKIWKIIGTILFVAIIIAVVGLILWGLYYLVIGLYMLGVLISPIIGSVLYILSLFACMYWLIVLIFALSDGDYNDIPLAIRRIGAFIPAALVVRLFDVYALDPIVLLVKNIAIWVWGVISYAPELTIAVVVIIAILIVTTKLLIISEKDERTFAKIEKIITYVSVFGVFIPLICFIVYAGVSSFAELFSLFGVIPVVMKILFSLTVLTVLLLLSRYMVINKDTIEIREKARELSKHFGIKDQKIIRKGLVQNNNIDPLFSFAKEWFTEEYRTDFLVAAIYSKKALSTFDQYTSLLKKIDDEWERFMFMKLILQGHKAKKALALLKNEKTNKEVKSQKIKQTTVKAQKIISEIGRIVAWPFIKVWQLLCTLKDIWDLFNKFCPYISKAKYID